MKDFEEGVQTLDISVTDKLCLHAVSTTGCRSSYKKGLTTEITKLFAPQQKRSIAFGFLTCSRGHLERPDLSRGNDR